MYHQQVNDGCQPCGGPDIGLEYVGGGRGEFMQEPQMKYVGYGGDYSVRRRRDMTCLLITSLLGLLGLLALLCWMFWPCDECKKGLDNWQYEWSKDKVMRCCQRGFIWCPTETPPPPAAFSGPVDPYNCALGDLNWQAGWSTEKKQWCCQEHGKGCGHDGPAAANMYDCNAGDENWVKGWSENKKQWCCSHGYKGCPEDAAAAIGGGFGAGSHSGATPFGAPIAGHENGFVPHSMATKGFYTNGPSR